MNDHPAHDPPQQQPERAAPHRPQHTLGYSFWILATKIWP
jgi:hypothetical protein